jgi:GDP-mannose 6-dehydrogenase
MKVAILGLGYVGTVCGACLAEIGHQVIGADLAPEKVAVLNSGRSPIVEPGLDDLVASMVQAGRLRATTSTLEALAEAQIAMICVGTPSRTNGSLNMDAVMGIAEEIGRCLRELRATKSAPEYPVVVLRSTVVPGTLSRIEELLARNAGLRPGQDFAVASNPEFLREGSALSDFRNPPYTLVGTREERAVDLLREMYEPLQARFIAVSPGPAELIKFLNNSWHALKVAFANEVGATCQSLGIDSHEVMELFCEDRSLNISPAYLRPGFAYGGSCLPKDLAALNHLARSQDVQTPILASVAQSNREHLQRAIQLIQSLGSRRVGILGLSFKPGTDDLRESPTVELVETLLGKGYQLNIFDSSVNMARLIGANKVYIEQRISHLKDLLQPDMESVLSCSDIVVVANGSPEFRTVANALQPQQHLVDLVRIDPANHPRTHYHGICW